MKLFITLLSILFFFNSSIKSEHSIQTNKVFLKETSSKINGTFLFDFAVLHEKDSVLFKKFRIYFKEDKEIDSLNYSDLIVHKAFCSTKKQKGGITINCNDLPVVYYSSESFKNKLMYKESVYNLITTNFLRMSNQEKLSFLEKQFK